MGNFLTTTVPSPAIQDTDFTLSITDEFTESGGTFLYPPFKLTLAGTYISTDFVVTNNFHTITFGGTIPINIPVSGTIPVLVEDDFLISEGGPSNNTFEDTITMDAICYAEGTRILCLIDGNEKYVNVEELKKDMLVKTYNPHKDEYKKMVGISKSLLYPSKTHKLSKIHMLKKNKLGENLPFEDLYVTGGHSYLVDSINDKHTLEFMEQCNPVFGAKIHDKYKLLTAFSDEWNNVNMMDKSITIYHFALEHEHEFGQYGVYANGILSETMSLHFFKKRKTQIK
jgi:hypothetical protein